MKILSLIIFNGNIFKRNALFSIKMTSSYLERLKEEAKMPRLLWCTVISREPYKLETRYGVLEISPELVPLELRNQPGEEYLENVVVASLSADLDKGRVTSFVFNDYVKKATQEMLTRVDTIESLPVSEWPRKK